MNKSFLQMKSVCFTIITLIFLIVLTSGCNYYSSNNKIKNLYISNKECLNQYISDFDADSYIKDKNEISNFYNDKIAINGFDYSHKYYRIPKYLSDISVTSIEYYNGFVFFDFPATGNYYDMIYYSKSGKPSAECPLYSNDSENPKYGFREVKNGIFINGVKNDGGDWYKTERIEDNWYYCEVHLS